MRILVVDDHPMVLAGCKQIFSESKGFKEVIGAFDADGGLRAYLEHRPDVAIIDFSLPGTTGAELTREILRHDPEARIVIFSMNDGDWYVSRALGAGAKGFVSKNDDPLKLLSAVQHVKDGGLFPAIRVVSPDG